MEGRLANKKQPRKEIEKPGYKNLMDLQSFLANCEDETIIREIGNCLAHLRDINNDETLYDFWIERLSILNSEVTSRDEWAKKNRGK